MKKYFYFYLILKNLKPELIIESGVYKGQSTWLIENTLPNSKIISIDIDLNKKIGIWIDLQMPGGGVLANLTGRIRKLRNRDILWSCIRRPLGSRRALALIHWQALKLYLKGARYRKRPSPPDIEVS